MVDDELTLQTHQNLQKVMCKYSLNSNFKRVKKKKNMFKETGWL